MRFKLFNRDLKILHVPLIKLIKKNLSSSLKSIYIRRFKQKTCTVVLSTVLASYGYQQFINNELEIIYTPTDFSNEMLESMPSIKNGKYYGSPYLFLRCMEIIYGNTIENRYKVDYDREIIYTEDEENLALGMLNRLVL